MKSYSRRAATRLVVSSLATTFALGGQALASEPQYGGTLRIASLQADLDAFDPLTGYSTDSWEILRAVTRQLVTIPAHPPTIKDDTSWCPTLPSPGTCR
jgi:peptide/nickel transport system substrate-binding protein